jgi:hypothetical protein
MTEYKIVKPLLTKHVEPFLDWWRDTKEERNKQTILTANKNIVLKAVELAMFEGEKPDPDNMEPKEVIKLGDAIASAQDAAVDINIPNSQPAPPDMPKG